MVVQNIATLFVPYRVLRDFRKRIIAYRSACESGCGDQPDQGFDKIMLETFGQRQALVLSLTLPGRFTAGRFEAGGCALRRSSENKTLG